MATSSASASSTKAIIILIIVGLLVFTLPTVLVLITGMVPSFIAYATDRRREKYKTLSVGCKFTGCVAITDNVVDKRSFI
jgi:hypothetical protein